MTTAARCGAASGRRHGCHQGVYTVGGETVDTVCRAEGHGFKLNRQSVLFHTYQSNLLRLFQTHICVVCDVRKSTNLVKNKGDLGGKVMTMQKALPCSFASSCSLLLAAAAPTAHLALLLLLLIAWNHLLLQPTPPLSILPRTVVASAASATRSFFDALLNNNVCVPGQHLTPHTPHTSHLTPHT